MHEEQEEGNKWFMGKRGLGEIAMITFITFAVQDH